MLMVKERLNKLCEKIKEYSEIFVFDIKNLEVTETGYKKGHTPPADGWAPLGILQGAHKHFWIKACFKTPSLW